MKNTVLKSVFALAILSISISSMAAVGGGSFELMCRSRAKEIATETYKNCVTENKQTQIKEVRKEYEQELAAVKNRFENKLKKISKGESAKSEAPTQAAPIQSVAPQSSDDNIPVQNNKPSNAGYIKRSSGARELPTNSGLRESMPKDQPKNDLSNNTDASSVEIVEIPAEQE
ncbi:hypothetical protein CIK05_07730 [Bdellovibrio sp. qaytius]|nr:hypothetical protein CIK05_07730 [Bdellovibrio sp. qaytius]